MIDPIKILQRAWHILWNYRTLWVFGLILALVAGSSATGRGNNSMQWREDNQSYQGPSFGSVQEALDYFNRELNRLFREGIPEANITGEALTAFLWTVGVFVVFMLLVGIVVTIAYYVSETAVIRMVDEYENSATKMTVREGVRIGWSRTAWQASGRDKTAFCIKTIRSSCEKSASGPRRGSCNCISSRALGRMRFSLRSISVAALTALR